MEPVSTLCISTVWNKADSAAGGQQTSAVRAFSCCVPEPSPSCVSHALSHHLNHFSALSTQVILSTLSHMQLTLIRSIPVPVVSTVVSSCVSHALSHHLNHISALSTQTSHSFSVLFHTCISLSFAVCFHICHSETEQQQVNRRGSRLAVE